ncbi:MAG: DUF2339 domain-containing protein [Candidatus Acidiferrales bacterium]
MDWRNAPGNGFACVIWLCCNTVAFRLPSQNMESGAAFFILVGAFLLIGIPVLAIAAFVRVGDLRRQVQAETPQLIARIYALERQLAQIEKALAGLSGAPTSRAETPAASTPSPAAAVTEIPAPASPRVLSQMEVPRIPTAQAVLPASPMQKATPVRGVPALSMPPSAAGMSRQGDGGNFEAMVAGRWLNYVGILALLFAVTFFLKYAFDNNWVGPRGRVGIGLLMGSALYPWSNRLLDRGYKYFSEGIAGLGAAVLYLSLWAGWHYYAIFTQSTAFALMIVVTAATIIVAIGRDSERIAFLALIGGLITPMLVSTGENHEVALFTYLMILGAGVLGIAWVRNWKSLPPAQFVATLIYFWGWYSEFYRNDELTTTIVFATVFFILFAALPVVRSWREGDLSGLESAIVLINSLAYLVTLRVMLWPQNRWALTAAVLLLAAAHLGAERMLPEKRGGELRVARILYAGLALTFVTLAIPIRLDGRWITLAWAMEGAVLIWSGLRVRFPAMRWAGLAMFAVVAGRLVAIRIPGGDFLLNARFATFAIGVACILAACYFAGPAWTELSEAEKTSYSVAAVGANVLALVALSLEFWDVFGRMPSLGIDRGHAQELALSMLWLVYALGLLGAGLWKKSEALRWQALVLLGVVIVKVFLFDLSFLEAFYRIVSFFLLGLALLIISFYYQRQLVARKAERKI